MDFHHVMPVVSEPDSLARTWLDLVTRYEVKGKQTHDAKIVASMLSLGITHILTLNPQDFARYAEITTITP
jgi:predicted nucleic acid-binding protein